MAQGDEEAQHIAYLRRAIALASENVGQGGGPFGALIVRGDEVVATGVNRVTAENDPTAHAEVKAIRAACQKLGQFSLAGCRIYSSCEPCPMCLAALYWAGVDAIYYAASQHDAQAAGFDDAFIYRELALPAAQRSVPQCRLIGEEGLESFALWMQHKTRTPY